MKRFVKWGLLGTACGWAATAGAQLELVTNLEPSPIFSGTSAIPVGFYNPAGRTFHGPIQTRIFQVGSVTAVPFPPTTWKTVEVPPGETVLQSAALNFPPLQRKAEFLIQWLEHTNRIIGVTHVLVYPTNLLQALRPYLGETNFGVLDPDNQLKPLLRAQGIEFSDLEETELDDFAGRLAVIGPFRSPAEEPAGLRTRIEVIAKKNVAVVWIQPPGDKPDKLLPSFYAVQKARAAVVMVQPDLVSDLAQNPQSQLNLVCLCRWAMDPPPLTLPDVCRE